MDTVTTFATRLKELRTAHNLNQEEFGAEIGISRGSVSYYEKGERVPDIYTLTVISKYFNVSSDYLIGLSDVKSINPEITAICKYTGLSEKALASLPSYFSIINLLLELNSSGNFFTSLEHEDDLSESVKEWNEKHAPVLKNIEDYIFMDDIDESVCFAITKSGKLRATTELKKEWSDRGVLTCEDAYDFYSAKTLRQSQIIEEMLLSEIRDNLKKCKRLVKEGRNNGNSN